MAKMNYDKLHALTVEQVVHVPEVMEPGILYISKRFALCIHLCACGCSAETVMPLDPEDGWFLTGTDEVATIRPSVLNPHPFCPNAAHYYITDNRIDWL